MTVVGTSRLHVEAVVSAVERAVSADRLLVVVDCEGVLCEVGSGALPPIPSRAVDAIGALASVRNTTVAVWSARPSSELESSVAALSGSVVRIGVDAGDGFPEAPSVASARQGLLDRIEHQVQSHPSFPAGAKVVRGRYSVGIRLHDVGGRGDGEPDAGGVRLAAFLASVFEWTWRDDGCDLGIGRDELWVTVGSRSKGDAISALIAASRPDAVLLVSDEAALDDAAHFLGPKDRYITVGPPLSDTAAADGMHADDRAAAHVDRGEVVLDVLDALAALRSAGTAGQSSSER